MNLVLGVLFGVILHNVLDMHVIVAIIGAMGFTALFPPLHSSITK